MSGTVQLDFSSDSIARLTLDEPVSRANTLHRAVWEQLGDACARLANKRGVRGLILRSAKPGIFVAGADLREIAELPIDDPEPTRALVRRGRDVLAAFESLPFPSVALIDGAALGGGFELALACDYRLAGTNPKIKVGFPEVKLGLIPGWGGTQRTPRMICPMDAARLVCLGESLSAESANDQGLVDGVSESDDLDDGAVGLINVQERKRTWEAHRRRKHSPLAHPIDSDSIRSMIESKLPPEQQSAGAAALQVIIEAAGLPLSDALPVEEKTFVELVANESARKLIAAFLKR
jgi:enoyl-CoA hydratase/carnithine racemase